MRRTTELRLRRTFADVLGALLATTGVVAVAGCGGSTSETSTTTTPGTNDAGLPLQYASACTKGNSYSLLSGLKASPEIDGAIMRTEMAFRSTKGFSNGGGVTGDGAPEDGDDWKATNGETVGSLCSKATNQADCLDKVGGYRVLPPTREACESTYPGGEYQGVACYASYILYTRGDEIGVARTVDETKALIGTFDTLEEVLWVARQKNLSLSCSTGSQSPPQSTYKVGPDGGFDLILIESENCGKTTFQVTVHVDVAGNLTETSRKDLNLNPGCAVAGRRPDGLSAGEVAGIPTGHGTTDAIGLHFAEMASLEAASVVAFRRLRRELAAHGAPRDLLDRMRTAARDEIRHARATRALAEKYGVTPLPPRIAPAESRSLFAIALENAREGCVRETYGALVAQLQMVRAADADVRRTMTAIADEETEHAALSWDIAAWIETQLDTSARERLANERRAAMAALAVELSAPVDARVRSVSGVPDVTDALRMLEGLEPIVFAAA